MKELTSLDEWITLAGELAEAGYSLYQTQYSWYDLEGFHAWFWASGRPQIEIMTRNCTVQEATVRFKPK